MTLLDRIAESRIVEAQQRGEFERLPGAGKRLTLDDDAFVAPELRSAYRLLKNAGCLPPELQRRRQIADLESLLHAVDPAADAPRRDRLIRKINYLRASLGSRGADLRLEAEYLRAVGERLVANADPN